MINKQPEPKWVSRLSDPERREYYNKPLAIKCPIKPKGDNWRICDCVDFCEFVGREFRKYKNGCASFIICVIDEGERDLETGKRTRNN